MKLFYPVWGEEDFYFIPKYNDDNKSVKTLTNQKQRVVFYAICRYFEQGEYEEISLKRWMRIVWNIVENGNIEDPQTIIGAMRLIDELANYSRILYAQIANTSFFMKSNFAKEQIKEEREKARIIVKDENFTEKAEYVNWEEKIIVAEKELFFKGKINYLLNASENNVDNFGEILTLCQAKIQPNEKSVLRDYLTFIDRETLPLCCNISSYNKWKEILTDKKSERATIEFFRNRFNPHSDNSWPDWKAVLINDFEEITPLNCTIRNYVTNGWWGYGEEDVFVYVNANISGAKFLSSKRKGILIQLIEKKVIQNQFPLYPNTNDRGQLWINPNSFTEDFKAKLKYPDRIHLFLSKNTFELRLWNNNRWEGIEIELGKNDDIFCTIIESVEKLLL